MFGERFAERLSGRTANFDQLYNAYRTIGLSAGEREAFREERAASRGHVIGGGFGIEGAAQGMVLAGVANAALGMAHGIANAAGNAVSSIAAKREKAELYGDASTKSALADVVFDAAFQAHMAVATIVNERRASPAFDAVPMADEAKAGALLNNVVRNRVPDDAVANVLVESLNLNPFAKDIWFEWLARFGDRDSSLATAADSVGVVELAERKMAVLAEALAKLPTDTPDECYAGIAVLEEQAMLLGADCNPQRQSLLAKAEALALERRSFRGEAYKTEEEASVAAQEWNRLELDKIAGQMSTEKLPIRRDGDQLVFAVTEPPAPSSIQRLLEVEGGKLQPPGEKLLIVVLIIAGVSLIPVAGLGLVLILGAYLLWRQADSRRQNSLRAAHPAIFGPPKNPVGPTV